MLRKFLLQHFFELEFPCLIFVQEKALAEAWSKRLPENYGVSAAFVTGDVPEEEREKIKSKLIEGTLQVAVCTNCWATGVDIPGLASVVNCIGGSAPIGRKQSAGRAVRAAKGKSSFTVWDVVEVDTRSTARHLPRRLDAYREAGYVVDGARSRDRMFLEQLLDGPHRPRQRSRRSAPQQFKMQHRGVPLEQQQRQLKDPTMLLTLLIVAVSLLVPLCT